MRALAFALALCLGAGPAVDAAAGKQRSRDRLTLVKQRGRGHIPAWLLQPIAPVTIAPAPATAPQPGVPPAESSPPAAGPGESAPPAEQPPASPQRYSRSGVDLREFTVRVTRNTLDAGAIELVATNFGEDDHDMALSQDGVFIAKTPVIAPQTSATLNVELAAGTYKVYCSLLDHEAAGMRASLVVR